MIAEELGDHGARRFALVFETGDEVPDRLTAFAEERELGACHFTAIGAFREATIAWFNPRTNEYEPIEVQEQVEVVSLMGNVARGPEGGWKVHAHVVLGRRDGGACAGHLVSARVRPTVELFLTETTGDLRREIDEATGLPLIR